MEDLLEKVGHRREGGDDGDFFGCFIILGKNLRNLVGPLVSLGPPMECHAEIFLVPICQSVEWLLRVISELLLHLVGL